MRNILLDIQNRTAFREWLIEHGKTESECWIIVERGDPQDDEHFWFIDAVEEALCFGWIDGMQKKIDGVWFQRFSRRKHFMPWSELDKERVRRLKKLGLMTNTGWSKFPFKKNAGFILDPDIEKALKDAELWETFTGFPPLYQRVSAWNITYYKEKFPGMYRKCLRQFLDETGKGNMYGEWNDYGRLVDY